ncbi:MAG TPA: decarboxylase [Burkholderiaceae bacterium]|nr:decarboxylase [Burkholderiaceae bacterium]
MTNDTAASWEDKLIASFKRNDVRLITYVPDKVLAKLIRKLQADSFFTVLNPSREEEAVAIVAGAWMGGTRGIVLMQTSGFATLPNALASLAIPYQIPVLMLVSERGTLGDHQLGQVIVCRTLRPILDCLNIENHDLDRVEDVEFIADKTMQQAFSTQAPAAMIISPRLFAR